MSDELKDKEFEISGKKIGGETTIRFNLKTLVWILGILYLIGAWFYFDLRKKLDDSSIISKEEKEEFLKEIEEEYEDKFTEMLREIYDIKGSVKVILDRTSRTDPIIPNPEMEVTAVQPPPGNISDDSIE